jgi:predicted GNAT family N-acyltransferase
MSQKNRAEEIVVLRIQQADLLEEVFRIRREVFVEEQHVPEAEEYDTFEDTSRHFLVIADGNPVATARWRVTDLGIKLERFAVRQSWRGQGVGGALLQAVLEDVQQYNADNNLKVYLHAQLDAIPFYSAYRFVIEGERFEECNILHYKMYLKFL